jgi:hypothetical protein
MLALLGLALALVLIVALIYAELHSAWYEVTLSNGIEVLVNPEMHEEIVRRFQMSNEPDVLKRWDEAVLSVLRLERPAEWEFLAYLQDSDNLQGQSANCGSHEFVTIP